MGFPWHFPKRSGGNPGAAWWLRFFLENSRGSRHSIAENVGKQRRGAVHGAGFAIGHGLGFGIQQLAIDHLSQHQHVVAGRVFATTWHSNQASASRSKGSADAARRPLRQSQFVGAGRPAVMVGQI